jgi:type II secretory pathway pseudopilin PulG
MPQENEEEIFDKQDSSPVKQALDKKKKVIIIVAVVAIIAMVALPELLKPKQTQKQEEPVKAAQTNRNTEMITFEKQAERQKRYEDLTPQEKQILLQQAREEVLQEYDIDSHENVLPKPQQSQRQAVQHQQTNNYNIIPSYTQTPEIPYKWYSDRETHKLLDKDFTQATVFYKNQSLDGRWAMSSGAYRNALENKNVLSKIDLENLNLLDGTISVSENKYVINAGTYIRGITTGKTHSDYPEAFVARITHPSILRGWIMICKSGRNNAGRVPVSVDKLVSPEGKELTINGQVEMASIPGMTGEKHSRWLKRMAPSMINAGIGGGLLVWSMREEEKNRDAMLLAGGSGAVGAPVGTIGNSGVTTTTNTIIEPMIQDGIGGFQKEITRSFQQGNLDDYVILSEGTTFDILLLSSLTIRQ